MDKKRVMKSFMVIVFLCLLVIGGALGTSSGLFKYETPMTLDGYTKEISQEERLALCQMWIAVKVPSACF